MGQDQISGNATALKITTVRRFCVANENAFSRFARLFSYGILPSTVNFDLDITDQCNHILSPMELNVI